jgi:hypothetical protein
VDERARLHDKRESYRYPNDLVDALKTLIITAYDLDVSFEQLLVDASEDDDVRFRRERDSGDKPSQRRERFMTRISPIVSQMSVDQQREMVGKLGAIGAPRYKFAIVNM